MIMLFINTAGVESVVALYKEGRVLLEKRWKSEQRLGADLLPTIDHLLQEASITLADLSMIAVFPGPGSFTGTRIGVTTANALAFGLNIPVIDSKTASFEFKNVELPHLKYASPVVPHYATPASVTIKKKII